MAILTTTTPNEFLSGSVSSWVDYSNGNSFGFQPKVVFIKEQKQEHTYNDVKKDEDRTAKFHKSRNHSGKLKDCLACQTIRKFPCLGI